MKCKKCGGTEWRDANSMTKRDGWVTRSVCVQCEKVRSNDRYARLTDEQKAKRLKYKRAKARACGVRSRRDMALQARQKKDEKVRRRTARAGAVTWADRARAEMGDGENLRTIIYRVRYRDDIVFRTKEIERRRHNRGKELHYLDSASDGSLTVMVVVALFANATRCPDCGKMMRSADKTMDHIVPRSKGGMHTIANVRVICRSCNCRKSATMPEQPTLWRAA